MADKKAQNNTGGAGQATDATAEIAAEVQETDTTAETPTGAETVDFQAIVAGLEAELAEARTRSAEAAERYQRMAAEFQNSRRRQEKQLADEIDRASAHLVRRLLPIVDDFDLAFNNVPAGVDAASPWVEGFRQIQKKLHAMLEEAGVEQIAAEGEFDPTLHEAISSEPSDSVASGAIIAAVRSGYMLKGQVLRPALVRVAL